MDLTIVIPAYNEEKSIGATIKKVSKYQPDAVILVVDDGSSDRTREIAKKNGVKVISHRKNMGYGAALKTGFRNTDTALITFLDADLTYHPKYITDMISLLEKENLDVVWGDRFGGSVNKMPKMRKFGNRIISLVLFMATLKWVNDCTSGERVFRKGFQNEIDIETISDDLDFITGMTARIVKRKKTFRLVPMDYQERGGSSKLKRFKHGYKMMRNIIMDR